MDDSRGGGGTCWLSGGATSQPAARMPARCGIPSAGVRRNGCWTPPPFSVEGWGRNNNMTMTSLQRAQHTSGGAVTADTNCCANCVETSRPQQLRPDSPFFWKPVSWTRLMAGAPPHKKGNVETNLGSTPSHKRAWIYDIGYTQN